MTTVHVACTKWGGGQHWTFDATLLGTDRFGTWIGAPAGTLLQRPGAEIRLEAHAVQLLTPGAWSTPTFYGRPVPGASLGVDVYVDIITGCHDDTGTWRMIDLDLDVVRTHQGAVEIVDQDEFAEHQVDLGYPPDVIAGADAAASEVAAAIARGDEPYATVGWHWLDRSIAAGG